MNFLSDFDITYCPYSSFSKIYSCNRRAWHGLCAVLLKQLSTILDCPVLSLSCPFCLYPERMTSFRYLLSSALIASFLEHTLHFCSVFLCSFVQHPAILRPILGFDMLRFGMTPRLLSLQPLSITHIQIINNNSNKNIWVHGTCSSFHAVGKRALTAQHLKI